MVERANSRGHRARWAVAVALAVVVPAGWALARFAGGAPESAGTPVRGVFLGMTPGDVRARFAAPTEGRFLSETGEDGALALVWRPIGQAPVAEARFEFHLGLLVAMRYRVAPGEPEATGDLVEVTDGAVRHRIRSEQGTVQLSIIARNCPTHAAEVAELLAGR